MAPKKKEVVEEKPLLGRFKSHLRMGIVGMPNVGKSTLFNTLTKCAIPAENFPFCTIEPNEARVNIPDERFDWLCNTYRPKSKIPAFLEVVDIAGLVKGAADGAGLGNAFLSNISAVDGIFHVCRAFEDPDVIHVEDRIDPVEDLEIIHAELRAKDLARVKTEYEALRKMIPRGLKKEQKEDMDHLEKITAMLEEGKDIRHGVWGTKEIEYLNTLQLLSSKPVVYLVNLTEKDYARKKNKWLNKIAEWVFAKSKDPIIPFSGALEQAVVDMPEDEAEAHCKELGATSALPKIIKTGFTALSLIYFFTAGPDEVKCWTIRKSYKAPQAAGTIHTDFERGFICAEVMEYADLTELGNEAAVKAAGKYRQKGKDYVVQDGDVIFFKFNVTASAKK
mmetsp:Transcript_7027/g.12755  ORF Transcript_7027/g.12755 Transcript_7027/m.12755 type:complete len:392 (-) Transcript_7027:155-1330(-)